MPEHKPLPPDVAELIKRVAKLPAKSRKQVEQEQREKREAEKKAQQS